MCGRYAIHSSKESLEKHFGVQSDNDSLFTPDYNVSPGANHPVCLMPKPDKKGIGGLFWGLIPKWAKDRTISFKLMNARSETLDEKPSFKNSFQYHRCLIPANGFYEWEKSGTTKTPFYITLKEQELAAFAGLYARWIDPLSKEMVWSYTIITTQANELLKPIHERMPVILEPKDYNLWLDPTFTKTETLKKLFESYPSQKMEFYPVRDLVNSIRNNSPELLEKLI